jgi:hypothetical protein
MGSYIEKVCIRGFLKKVIDLLSMGAEKYQWNKREINLFFRTTYHKNKFLILPYCKG